MLIAYWSDVYTYVQKFSSYWDNILMYYNKNNDHTHLNILKNSRKAIYSYESMN